MKRLLFFIVAIVLIFASFLAPNVAALDVYHTAAGMKTAFAGTNPQSFLMMDPAGKLVTAFWPQGSSYAFATVHTNGAAATEFMREAANATKADVRSVSDLINFLTGHGWKVVTPAALPTSLVTQFTRPLLAILTSASVGTITVLILPTGAFDLQQIYATSTG